MTQQQLAERVGVTRQTIHSIESIPHDRQEFVQGLLGVVMESS